MIIVTESIRSLGRKVYDLQKFLKQIRLQMNENTMVGVNVNSQNYQKVRISKKKLPADSASKLSLKIFFEIA